MNIRKDMRCIYAFIKFNFFRALIDLDHSQQPFRLEYPIRINKIPNHIDERGNAIKVVSYLKDY